MAIHRRSKQTFERRGSVRWAEQKIKDQQSAELKNKVDAFLAAGGEIQVVPHTLSAMHLHSGDWNQDLMSRLQTQKRLDNVNNP
jgi:hypothetical protein